MLRPRGGNFNYNDNEIHVIINDVIRLRDLGIDGIVIGIVNEKGVIPIKKLEKICLKLDEYIPFSKPSLIHGDLWTGNLIFDIDGKPVFIDPAIYYGHPEMDWAMLSLFGSYPETAMKSYCNIIPLENNYLEREKIYQLYPLLVHLILFGRGYYRNISDILNFYS